jgi:plastocyanin
VSYADLSITVGDALAFVSYSGHDVALVHTPSSGTHWDQCGGNGIGAVNFTKIFATTDFTAALTKKHYTPPTCGEFYIACSVGPHCMYGQRVKVTVKNADGKACASPCLNGACVTSASKSLATGPTEYALKPRADSKWWGTGPYDELEVNVGDTVLFQTGAGFHDVATLPTRAGFDDCNMAGMTVVADWTYGTQDPSTSCKSAKDCCTGSSCAASGNYVTYVFNATSAGETHFVCSIGNGGHCKTGQRLLVKAQIATASTTAAPAAGTNGFGTGTIRW